MMDDIAENDSISFSYTFTPRETAHLAYFLRRHQEELPLALLDFFKKLETSMYNSMSITQAERFYS